MTRAEELEMLRQSGKVDAMALQERSSELSGTELNAEDDKIPRFKAAVKEKNMLDRKAGQQDGFVCLSTAGRVVRLIQNYNSDIYQEEPENLPAQYRFVWSTDPAKARPFIASSTSYYNTGDCCLNKAGEPRRSKIDANVFDPDASPEFWEDPYAV